jgi:hypothetical protein
MTGQKLVVKIDDETAQLIECYNINVELAVKCLLCRSQCKLKLAGKCPLDENI